MKTVASTKQEGDDLLSPNKSTTPAAATAASDVEQQNGSDAHGSHSSEQDPAVLTPSRSKKLREKLNKAKYDLQLEKGMKRKLYQGLVKLASELKDAREEYKVLKEQSEQGEKNWYEGGMWRGPELLPGIRDSARHRMSNGAQTVPEKRSKDAVSLSDLFFDLVIVTAFTRVGVAIQDRGGLDGASLAYFCVFWLIWGKEASFSTRFDTTDLSSRIETLLTCFAVLFGSLSSTAMFDSGDATRMMIVAAFIAMLHFLLHLRVWYWFRDVSQFSEMICVKQYAQYVMALTALEFLTWVVGIISLSETSSLRAYIFLIAIILSFRVPRSFLPNDFHAACSKRGVLFILLLGFVMQSIVLVASPFFDYQMPNSEQYCFLGLVCFLLFCIKLLYVDDSFSVQPSDHALLVSRAAGFFFHIGQLCLLLSTTILGAGLNLLTHSYLAATASLPDNAKALVCNGFAGVVFSIGFIKSMHLRRVPLNPVHRQLFYAAYGTQVVVLIAVVYATHSISVNRFTATAMMNELEMLGTLCSLALFLLIISWLDEAVELNIYGEGDAREFRVHPFGLWTCLKPGSPEPPLISDTSKNCHLSTRLKGSNANLFDSQFNLPIYGSVRNVTSEDDEERVRLVKFSDEVDMNEIDDVVV
eukprot:CAMPEP_0176496344 /NCGR_PEP_ID=MMETSP0200_2-20121128/11142_1 /TAXON_ID=947934 /ORGANISM="Chaetoceros sp., Strain GSL56" /LENGTH=641 /DNA_ID=CAMNT_0017894287 /DNA_START=636 /DNA_END=2561 /DNA_ORIENTATION=-